jgi:hypothetical protein
MTKDKANSRKVADVRVKPRELERKIEELERRVHLLERSYKDLKRRIDLFERTYELQLEPAESLGEHKPASPLKLN